MSASSYTPMRVIVLDGRARRDSEPLIAHTAAYLGRYGIRLDRVRVGRQPRLPYEAYAALIATSDFPFELRRRLDCYGKSRSNMPTRPETLEWMQQAGLPTMRWSLASNHREVDELFERWRTDAILLKRSDTFGYVRRRVRFDVHPRPGIRDQMECRERPVLPRGQPERRGHLQARDVRVHGAVGLEVARPAGSLADERWQG